MDLIITKPYIQNVEGEDKTRLVSTIKIEGKKIKNKKYSEKIEKVLAKRIEIV